ncbi:transglycosylase [Sulfurifustis variabilis]|uniref:Transglycosylase n=1 Tax=Sulfurifustis variabilis TaxID=1675686 RepID=A0A1B4V6I5_9GAMM|nr:lytic transglycosylase domain-containing protein [Sulfurifustis variabilis]BAU49035.1 transglycosylase [Sulfurifustis variabilis]
MRRSAFQLLAFRLLVLVLGCLASGARAGSPPDAAPAVDAELRALLSRAVAEAESFPDRFEAEVWLLDMSRRLAAKVPDQAFRLDLLKSVHAEATRARLPPELVLAVIEVESNFDPFAISHAGARGLMQVMPFWLKEIGRPGDSLFRVRTNLRYGCTILRYYLDKEKGNLWHALARYNGSRGQHWYPTRVNHALNTRWFRQ